MTIPKTRKVAVYPDGTRYVLRFSRGMWWWGPGRGSYPQSAVAGQLALEYGGWIEVEPNPAYERQERTFLPTYHRIMKEVFG